MIDLVLSEDLGRSLRRGRHRRRAHDKILEEGGEPSYSAARSLVVQGVCTVRREGWEHTWLVTPHPRALAAWRAERGATLTR